MSAGRAANTPHSSAHNGAMLRVEAGWGCSGGAGGEGRTPSTLLRGPEDSHRRFTGWSAVRKGKGWGGGVVWEQQSVQPCAACWWV